jgi:hypothetical protein
MSPQPFRRTCLQAVPAGARAEAASFERVHEEA